MKIFPLPDLGEGLPEAEIREWFISVGEEVTTDQPIAAVETAKALVDIPAPFDGKIEKLFGEPGDTIKTGKPFIGFAGESDESDKQTSGTVVGAIEESAAIVNDRVDTTHQADHRQFITPAIRTLARRLNVDIESLQIHDRRITKADIELAANANASVPAGFIELSPVRKAMAINMAKSHSEVVPITITDDANITSWFKKEDLTCRIIQAINAAIQQEPMMNAHFDADSMSFKQIQAVNLGLAVDTPHGLYVPVIKDAASLTDEALRDQIERYKQQAENKSITQDNLKDASIVLSNFGSFAARYGTPIITPPTVCIVGTGRVFESAIAHKGDISSGHLLPLSISADHRLITGGEITRFMQVLKNNLEG